MICNILLLITETKKKLWIWIYDEYENEEKDYIGYDDFIVPNRDIGRKN